MFQYDVERDTPEHRLDIEAVLRLGVRGHEERRDEQPAREPAPALSFPGGTRLWRRRHRVARTSSARPQGAPLLPLVALHLYTLPPAKE